MTVLITDIHNYYIVQRSVSPITHTYVSIFCIMHDEVNLSLIFLKQKVVLIKNHSEMTKCHFQNKVVNQIPKTYSDKVPPQNIL